MAEKLQEPTNSTGGGIDRRSLLTKAAAAGAVAWSVPLLMSEPAFAAGNGVCTAKCAPGTFTPILKGVDVCDEDYADIIGFAGSPLQTFFGSSNKMAILSVQAPGAVTCPCGGTSSTAIVSGLTSSSIFDKVGSQETTQAGLAVTCAPTNTNSAFEVQVFPLAGYGITAVVPFGQGFTPENSYAVRKAGGGAIGNSTNRLRGTVCVAVGCADKVGGDIVYRRCQYTLCFSYSPDSSCSTLGPVYSLFTPVPNSCKVGCGTAC